jgi:hypothetical protein
MPSTEQFPIQAFHDNIPPYVKFDFPDYTIAPTKKTELGISKVNGKVGNVQYNIFFAFEFYVNVINDPPFFDKIDKELPDFEVNQRDIKFYMLPVPMDKENQTISIDVKEQGKDQLPPYVTFYPSNLTLKFAPTMMDATGSNYALEVTLTDSFGSKSNAYVLPFKLEAYFPPPLNVSDIEIVYVNMSLTKIYRNGEA